MNSFRPFGSQCIDRDPDLTVRAITLRRYAPHKVRCADCQSGVIKQWAYPRGELDRVEDERTALKEMKFLLRALLEIVLAIVLLFVALVAGNILYRLIGDLFSPQGMDRSNDAAIGASMVFALAVFIVYALVRIIWRKKRK